MANPTPTIFLPYHALDQVLVRGTRAEQPAADTVTPGSLYSVTDEGIVEYSNGAAWTQWSTSGARSAFVEYSYSAATTAPPGPDQIRFNAGFPYTTVTKVWARVVTADGLDVYLGLIIVAPGATLLVQDKNDHTMYVRFTVTGEPIDNGTYIEFPVQWKSNGVSLGGGQPVLVQNRGGVTDVLPLHGETHEAGGTDEITALDAATITTGTLDAARLPFDYAEGEWAPTLTATGGASGQSYAAQEGNYQKIGSWVQVWGYVALSVLGSFTGNVLIGALPFTARAGDSYPVGVVLWRELSTTWMMMNVYPVPGTTTLQLNGAAAPDDNSDDPVPVSVLTLNSYFIFSLKYLTDD